MSIKYNSQYVDEKYVGIVEPNLYTDTVLIPGVTFTDKYVTGPAGQIMVHKLSTGAAVTPKAPGQDFTHEASEDELIAIAINNNFQKSRKIYGVQANAVGIPLAEENLADAVKMVAQGMQYSGLACLANEGTADTDTVAITTGEKAVEKLLGLRKSIKDAHGRANFALVNTELYRFLLQEVGFTYNGFDEATRDAALLKRFNLSIIECNSFDMEEAKYIDSTGATKTVDLSKVEMIVGYNEAFSIVPNLNAMRLIDSSDFVGTLAQCELNAGFKVNSPAQVAVKKYVAA